MNLQTKRLGKPWQPGTRLERQLGFEGQHWEGYTDSLGSEAHPSQLTGLDLALVTPLSSADSIQELEAGMVFRSVTGLVPCLQTYYYHFIHEENEARNFK